MPDGRRGPDMMEADPTRRPRGGPAVMSRRREPAGGPDDFPTPPWAVRALCEWLRRQGHRIDGCAVREPAAGRGHMARALSEYFAAVHESDVHAYGRDDLRIADFLAGWWPGAAWTITNPPFRLAEDFCRQALASSHNGVAMLVRTQFLEGIGRFDRLFRVEPPSAVLQFAERVPMLRGRLDPAGSTATAYCWLVWELLRVRPARGTALVWLPPCRRRLEREEDYA
jgi:hypothetical protein